MASIIEAYNTLKLYLLLTEPQAHPDPAFVAASLPQAWASAAGEGTPADAGVIAENAPLYVQLLEQGQAPSLPRNEQLINETRQNLKSFMISSSLVDREYLRLQLESSRQFPALSSTTWSRNQAARCCTEPLVCRRSTPARAGTPSSSPS